MPFARLNHTQWALALNSVHDLRQAEQHHPLLSWDPAWPLFWDSALVDMPQLNLLWCVFQGWTLSSLSLTLTKAQKSSATDSKEEQQLHCVSLCFCFAILLDSFSGPHLMGATVSPSVLLPQSFSCHTSCSPQDCSSIMNRGIVWKRKSG